MSKIVDRSLMEKKGQHWGPINEAIRARMRSIPMTPSELLRQTGFSSAGTLHELLTGKRRFNIDHLEKILPVLGLSFNIQDLSDEEREILKKIRSLSKEQIRHLVATAELLVKARSD